MKRFPQIILLVLTFIACGQGQIKTPEGAIGKLEEFHGKEKFVEDSELFYPGIADPAMKPILTDKINLAAKDFKELAKSKNPTAADYHEKIAMGLKRFSDIHSKLDTEDRERVCSYFEELMDIIGLKSSNGQLNDFMYGFDPME